MPELDAFLGESIYVRGDSLGYASKATGGIPVHIVRNEPQNIWARGWMAKLLRGGNWDQQCDSSQQNETWSMHRSFLMKEFRFKVIGLLVGMNSKTLWSCRLWITSS